MTRQIYMESRDLINRNRMKHILLGLICVLASVSAFGQTSKQRIDYLKGHLVYPKYEIGDTVYVWLQTMDDKPVGYMQGIEIKKYTIMDIALTNGGVYKHANTLSLSYLQENTDKELEEVYHLQYKYQLLPCDVKQIVGNTYPTLILENRVFPDYNSCLKAAQSYKED